MKYLKAYSWNPTAHPEIFPFTWVNMLTAGQKDAAEKIDSENQANVAFQDLTAKNDGKRVLFLGHFFTRQLRPTYTDYLPAFENGITDTATVIEWLKPLSNLIKGSSLPLDFIVIDCEDGLSVWNIWGSSNETEMLARIQRIYDSPAAFNRLPSSVKQYQPSDYISGPNRRNAIIAFNEYGKTIVNKSMRAVLYDSKIFHVIINGRLTRTWKMSNWEDAWPSFAITDVNGWPIGSGGIETSISSPSLYFWENGGVFNPTSSGLKKLPLWNSFIYCLNYLRSCIATKNKTVVPWISSPRWFVRPSVGEGFDDRNIWLWREMMGHIITNGVDTFIYWNPETDQAKADSIFLDTLQKNDFSAKKLILPKIKYDADEVITCEKVTTYQDFIANLPPLPGGTQTGTN